jgi:hypothetical protein
MIAHVKNNFPICPSYFCADIDGFNILIGVKYNKRTYKTVRNTINTWNEKE